MIVNRCPGTFDEARPLNEWWLECSHGRNQQTPRRQQLPMGHADVVPSGTFVV
jgi:hypothetical protein